MRQRARQLLVPLFILLAVACGSQLEEATGLRVSQAERVLGPEYESTMQLAASMDVVLFGEHAVDEASVRAEFARKMVEEKVRIKLEQDAAEEAARVKAEAERVAAEDAETARAAAEEAQAAKRARAAAVTAATPTTITRVAATTPTPARAAPVAPVTGGGGNTSGVDINCESGGNYATNTGNGYYGAYQWLPSTFNTALGQALSQGKITQETYDAWYGVRPDRVPPWVQDAAAAAHVAAGNRGAWPNC